MRPSQEQSSGDDSTNYQAARDVVVHHHGPTLTEVRAIVLDALKANMLELQSEAAKLVDERFRAFADKYAERLASESQEVLNATSDPGVQYAITKAGIDYARTGDPACADLLVDLLVDRAKAPSRELMAVVLDDALATAPRLTNGGLAVLAIVWRLTRTIARWVSSLQALEQFVTNEIVGLSDELPQGEATFLHLNALGCSDNLISQGSLAGIFKKSYGGLFTRGFPLEEVDAVISDHVASVGDSPLIPCLRDASRIQVQALNKDEIEGWSGTRFTPEMVSALVTLYDSSLMTDEEVVNILADIDPRMRRLAEYWSESRIKTTTLTAVGIAIGHAYWQGRVDGQRADLSIWIN